jgi:heparin binding hemagglutinin HbhA
LSDQAVELTQEALGNVASQTRAVGERAAKLVGVELPKKAAKAAPAKKAPAKKAPAKKAPAKKAAAKKVTQK